MSYQTLFKQFVPFNVTKQLIEINFDEECFGLWVEDNYRGTPDNPALICVGGHFGSSITNATMNRTDFTLRPQETIAPTISQVLAWFREKHGLYVHNQPEFYTNGINFNWQILWYIPKEQWKENDKGGDVFHSDITDGTFMYGDNGEYPTQEDADIGAIQKMIEIVKQRECPHTTKTTIQAGMFVDVVECDNCGKTFRINNPDV